MEQCPSIVEVPESATSDNFAEAVGTNYVQRFSRNSRPTRFESLKVGGLLLYRDSSAARTSQSRCHGELSFREGNSGTGWKWLTWQIKVFFRFECLFSLNPSYIQMESTKHACHRVITGDQLRIIYEEEQPIVASKKENYNHNNNDNVNNEWKKRYLMHTGKEVTTRTLTHELKTSVFNRLHFRRFLPLQFHLPIVYFLIVVIFSTYCLPSMSLSASSPRKSVFW